MKIFYEADCPFCRNFITNDLAPHTDQNDPGCLGQVQIDWIPYGNAAPSGDDVACQHGEDECFGNRLHLCAKREFGGDKQKMTNWVACVMANLMVPGKESHDVSTYQGCDGEIFDTITQCANNPESLEMLKDAGSQTQATHPQSVPWVVFEGEESYNSQTTFIQDLCNEEREKNLGQPSCCQTQLEGVQAAAVNQGGTWQAGGQGAYNAYGAYGGRRLLV